MPSHLCIWGGFCRQHSSLTRISVIHSQLSLCSFPPQKSSFAGMSLQQVLFQLVTQTCQLVWHSITPSLAAIMQVPQLGQHRSLQTFPWLAGLAWSREQVLQPENETEHIWQGSLVQCTVTGLAISDIFQFLQSGTLLAANGGPKNRWKSQWTRASS